MELALAVFDVKLAPHGLDSDAGLSQNLGPGDDVAPLDILTGLAGTHRLALIDDAGTANRASAIVVNSSRFHGPQPRVFCEEHFYQTTQGEMLPFCQVEHGWLEPEPGEMTMKFYGSPKQHFLIVMAAFVLCLALYPAVALAASALRMESPWARASLGGVRNAIVYGTLVNDGSAALTVVSGSTPVASRVEFHIHAMNGDVMTMKQLDSIALKPGERAALQPGGLHIMLIDLKQPLKQGASFPLTLVTADGTALDMMVKIESATAIGPTP